MSSSLDAPAPSIYSAAFDEGLIQSISLGEWLFIGFDPGLIIAAVLVAVLAVMASSYRIAAIRASIGAVVVISIADAIFLTKDGDSQPLGESIFYNLVGAPLIWLFLTSLFLLHDRICGHLNDLAKERALFGVASIGLATATSTVVWFLFQIFYNPASVQFSATASPPIEGVFVADVGNLDQTDDESEPVRPLSILPSDSLVRRINVNGFDSTGRHLRITWRQIDMETAYEIRVWPNFNCPYPQEIASLPTSQEPLVFEASTLEVQMIEGHLQFLGESEFPRITNLEVPLLAQYWIKADEEGQTSSIQAFVALDEKVIVNPGSSYRFYVGGPLIEIENQSSRSAQRELRFVVDGHSFVMQAGGGRLQNNHPLECLPIADVELIEGGAETRIVASDADTFFTAGALFDIREKLVPLEVFRTEQSRLVVEDANGWVEFSGFDFERMTDKHLGEGRGFYISRNLERLVIDGVDVDVVADDDLFTLGDLRARYEDNRLEISGTAGALWLNDRRMNPTVWERMDGWQIPFVTALIGMLGLLARWLLPRVVAFSFGEAGRKGILLDAES